MRKQRINQLEQMLAEEKEKLLEVEASLAGVGGLGQPMDVADTELSAYDNHPGDYGSQMYERSKDFGLLQITREHIAEIEEAQKAIREGSYGYCRNCGLPIPEPRLHALPRTLLCVQCKREQEDRDLNDRPVEEEVMYPPFGGSLDREDAWEAVARYGTSSYVDKD
jgi:YteA family regulatory protein